MADPATPSRPAKRQHTETIDLTSNSGDSIAAPESGEMHTVLARIQTLPTNFSGDLSTLPDFDPNAQELPSSQIARLPATFTNSLLAYAAARDPYINSILAHQHDLSILAHQHDLQRARERARVIDFTYYSQSAWDMLNTKYARLSSSKAYENVVSDIAKMSDTIVKIVRNAGGYDCSYGTRKNAVETMTEIMMCMVTAPNDEIGRRAWNYVHKARDMERRLLGMMKDYFARDELAQLDKEGWTDKVRELQLADRYSIYKRLDEVVEMLEDKVARKMGKWSKVPLGSFN